MLRYTVQSYCHIGDNILNHAQHHPNQYGRNTECLDIIKAVSIIIACSLLKPTRVAIHMIPVMVNGPLQVVMQWNVQSTADSSNRD